MSKFRRIGSLIAASTVTALALQGAVVAHAQVNGDKVTISISNFTDFHGHLVDGIPGTTADMAEWDADPEAQAEGPRPTYYGTELGAANLSALMKYAHQGQEEFSLRTTTGDNVGGTAFVSAISDDEYTIDAINAMGIQVNAAGNHEFDKGADDLMNRLVPAFDSQILAANVLKADGTPLLAPSVVHTFDGVKVGVVGTTSNQTPNKVSPAGIAGLEFTDNSAAANAEAKRLKVSGEADIVIVLQHDPAEVGGPKMDPEYVDYLFGGDSHLVQLNTETPVYYSQAWEYGKMLTDLDITYDKSTGEIVDTQVRQLTAKDFVELELEADPVVQAIVDQAVAESEVLGAEVVATIEDSFYRGSNPGKTTGSNRGVESTANNMLAESNRQAMDAFLGGGKIDLGLMNAGGVRSDLEAGEVTVEETVTMQPFGNNLAYATLSGAAILKALENQWQPGKERPRLSLGVSDNVSYVYNPDAPQGERIQHVTIDGEPLDPARDYTVATATFLFEGGDGFIDPDDVRDLVDVGYLDVTAFGDYLASGDAAVREGQGEIGVVLPEGGLKAGAENTIELTSLNYSSVGEPMATTVTVKIGDVEQTVDINNETTEADAGFGENGRATVKIELPAELTGAQTLTVTTDAGTNISMPVTVGGELTEEPSSIGGSSLSSDNGTVDDGKCMAAAIGWGLPLLAIAPLVIATQVNIPGLEFIKVQADNAIKDINNHLQANTGTLNPEVAAAAEQINATLGQFGTNAVTAAGGLAAMAYAIAAITSVVKAC